MKRFTIDVEDDFEATADEIMDMLASAQIGLVHDVTEQTGLPDPEDGVFDRSPDEDKEPTQWLNYYHHLDCPVQPGIEWTDQWDCQCNDRCPACNAEMTPYKSEEIKDRSSPKGE
jgi:hypothetical protein